jgi:transposase-like protein
MTDQQLDADDVLEGVDRATFEERRRANSMTPREERNNCPECGSMRVRTRGVGHSSTRPRGALCRECGWTWTDGEAGE